MRVLVAFSVAYVLGTVFGLLAGRITDFYNFSTTIVWISFSVPSVVWVFIFLLVFGISNTVPVLALIVFLMAPVVLGTAEGIRAIPTELDEMANSYRASRRQRIFELMLPSILPYMIANARVAFAFGMKIVLIAEVIGLPDGIGLVVRYWSDRLYMAPVIAWGVIVVTIGFIIDMLIFRPIEKKAARWAGQDVNAMTRIAE
jgi:NitT/TauT family transport system permease protein